MGKIHHEARSLDVKYLKRQRRWSRKTFGPGPRTEAIIDHMTKEFEEVRAEPDKVDEWLDLIILAIDGAWRTGEKPQRIINAIHAKLAKNEARVWPDWRTADPDKAIEHDRSYDVDVPTVAELVGCQHYFLHSGVESHRCAKPTVSGTTFCGTHQQPESYDEPSVHVSAMTPDGEKLGSWTTTASGEHIPDPQ